MSEDERSFFQSALGKIALARAGLVVALIVVEFYIS